MEICIGAEQDLIRLRCCATNPPSPKGKARNASFFLPAEPDTYILSFQFSILS